MQPTSNTSTSAPLSTPCNASRDASSPSKSSSRIRIRAGTGNPTLRLATWGVSPVYAGGLLLIILALVSFASFAALVGVATSGAATPLTLGSTPAFREVGNSHAETMRKSTYLTCIHMRSTGGKQTASANGSLCEKEPLVVGNHPTGSSTAGYASLTALGLVDATFPHGPAYVPPRSNAFLRILDKLINSLPPIVPEEGGGDSDGGSDTSSTLAGMPVAERIGAYRDMLKIKGNYGLDDVGFPDQVDIATANALGSEWVGPGAFYSSDGRTAILSADGLREYRFPATKKYQPGQLVNFEWRSSVNDRWISDGHMTVMDLENG
jgi:hypothetical protein